MLALAHGRACEEELAQSIDADLSQTRQTVVYDLEKQQTRGNLSSREMLILLCERMLARKESPPHRDGAEARPLPGHFGAQPSIEHKQIRDLAASRSIPNGENVLLLGPPGYIANLILPWRVRSSVRSSHHHLSRRAILRQDALARRSASG